MNPVLGYFLIINLGDGAFASKYSNTRSFQIFAECLVRDLATQVDPTDPFIGRYISTWIQDDNRILTTYDATLIIGRKVDSTSQYMLRWEDRQSSVLRFHGEGMLYQNQLIGAYWNSVIGSAL